MSPQAHNDNPGGDRRRAERFDTRLQVNVQRLSDNARMEAWAVEIGATGMRLETPNPLPEATQVRISFMSASNNTFCEGRVVWSRASRNGTTFDSGIDVMKWGGDLPTEEFIRRAPNLRLKPDRRRPR